MPKFFTVEEANKTLPLVRRIVRDIQGTHARLLARAEEYRDLQGGTAELADRRRELRDQLDDLTSMVNRYVGELHELGILFKGFEEGLVDFYARLDGRPVFLCWRLGEERIEWWHELDAGYVGRQRLPAHLLARES